jgi:hypothetical protein
MKALTLTQPWATLVAIGAKKIETRSWNRNYRGPLAIYTGKDTKFISMRGKDYICDEHPFRDVLMKAGTFPWKNNYPGDFPLGFVIATCELISIKKIDEYDWLPGAVWKFGTRYWNGSEQEKAFGDYTQGRYMWFLANVKILPEPIAAKGALLLWEWNEI